MTLSLTQTFAIMFMLACVLAVVTNADGSAGSRHHRRRPQRRHGGQRSNKHGHGHHYPSHSKDKGKSHFKRKHGSYVPEYAKYEVTVVFEWEESCPLPNYEHERFSPIIGCVHPEPNPFLEVGEFASLGVEQVAESGDTKSLEKKIRNHVKTGTCYQPIGPTEGSKSPGKVQFDIVVAKDASLVSFISMIAPSPDWFTGLLNIDLRETHGKKEWKKYGKYALGQYDAGTEEGKEFKFENPDTYPQEPIGPLTDRDISIIGHAIFKKVPYSNHY